MVTPVYVFVYFCLYFVYFCLYFCNHQVKHSDGAVDQCSFVGFLDAGMVMTTQSTVNRFTTLGSEGWTFGEVEASRRRRRQAGDEAHDNTTTKSGNGRQEAYLLVCICRL